jgi:hypothetical protein
MFFVCFVCVCFICVFFVFTCCLCLCVVLFLLLAIWLFTQHSSNQDLNYYYPAKQQNWLNCKHLFGASEFFVSSSFNGAKWTALLMWQKKWLWTLWNWRFMVLFVLNTEVNTVTVNHVSQNSHSAPSGHKMRKLMSWLHCSLGWLWNKIL